MKQAYQYRRRECLDIVGILSKVEADALEDKVVTIFEKLGCNILSNIVKFSQKKNCQQVWGVKRHLQKIKMENVDLPNQNKLSRKAYAHIKR